MAEMLEQKNKLAYDKGRLQSKVDQLQKNLESLANAQTDLVKARKSNTTLEAKYHKVRIRKHFSEVMYSNSKLMNIEPFCYSLDN